MYVHLGISYIWISIKALTSIAPIGHFSIGTGLAQCIGICVPL